MVENNQTRIRNGRGSGSGVEVFAEINVTIIEGYLFQVLFPA
jgi:hypothetical protein